MNKGAELMQRAVLERLRAEYPGSVFTMALSPGPSQPFRKVVDAGMNPKASLYYMGVQWGRLALLAPNKIRERYGFVLDRDVDVVIDAAGFSYSDQWGDVRTKELAHSAKRWRKQGTKVILMPQAFGPYASRVGRSAIRQAVDNIDLVMPREETSYKHLTNITGERENIRQYPDFTNLIDGVVPDYFDRNQHRVCLIPNYRMVDKTEISQRAAYLPFMARCARRLVVRGAQPFVLVHEGRNDMWLAERISEASGGIPIIKENDPLKIKGILGASQATIGSRFHGLVSALSQGVPSLATGWSHKYVELFRDYDFAEGLMSVEDQKEKVEEKIDWLIDEDMSRAISDRLLENSERLKASSESMWNEVLRVIDSAKTLGKK
ncbi:polysaccharide pyruvyl transferase family protein [Thioalkalivibrio sp. ALMg11]|uniref:polysaccharide pyruvyl transferase family protein n=1 Tax=Thioalkalivibrio sp. ALMg11 TaxID=1158165 RepID=UPI001E4B7A3B|nr:polysaccharide pyruvyl transferase family protein [Thioalkalivibrio sp. ALMg11]